MSSLISMTNHLVIDLGSDTIKIGFNGETLPRLVLPNCIGKIKDSCRNLLVPENKLYFAYDALYNSAFLNISYPKVESKGRFLTEDLNDYEKLFEYIFTEQMKIKQDQYETFIIDSIFTTVKERKIIAELLFEKFKMYRLHFEPQSIMSLYSSSKTSGLVVDSGEIYTEIVPIFEGYVVPFGIKSYPLAGSSLTKLWKDKINLGGLKCADFWVKEIKEKYAELKEERNEKDKKEIDEINFSLPDGNVIKIGEERHKFQEIFFNPSEFCYDLPSVQESIVDSIEKCDIFLRKELYSSIVLSGGNSLIKNFSTRLQSSLLSLVPEKSPKVHAFEDRKFSAWIGASGLCSLGQFQNKWLSKPDFLEFGEKVFWQGDLMQERKEEKEEMRGSLNELGI